MKVLGTISLEESEAARKLLGRKDALKELAQIIPMSKESEDVLYERILEDMAETSVKIEEWWKGTANKYGWAYSPTDRWYLNMATCEVSLDSK
jgi:CXXX repeat modification system protein